MAVNIFGVKLEYNQLNNDGNSEEVISIGINHENMLSKNLFVGAVFKELVYEGKFRPTSFSHEKFLKSIDNSIIKDYMFKGSYKLILEKFMHIYSIDSMSVYMGDEIIMLAVLDCDKIEFCF